MTDSKRSKMRQMGFALLILALNAYGLYMIYSIQKRKSAQTAHQPPRPVMAVIDDIVTAVKMEPPAIDALEQSHYVSGEYVQLHVRLKNAIKSEDFDSISVYRGGDTSGAKIAFDITSRGDRDAWLCIYGIDTGPVSVLIPASVRPLPGRPALPADTFATVAVATYVYVTNVEASQVGKDISITISFPMQIEASAKDVDSCISVDPHVPFRAEISGNHVQLIGPFLPQRRYSVRVDRRFALREGVHLAADYAGDVQTPATEPYINFSSSRTYHWRGGELRVPLEHAFVDRIDMALRRVYPNNLIEYLNRPNMEDLGDIIRSETFALSDAEKSSGQRIIDLEQMLGKNPRGVYELGVSGRDAKHGYPFRISKLVVVTELAVTVKTGADGLNVLVRSLKSSLPIAGARVTAYSRKNQTLASGFTDDNGRWKAPHGTTRADCVTVVDGGDWTYVKLTGPPLNHTAFDISGRPFLRDQYEAFIYFDRGVYRPNDTVHLTAMIRDPKQSAPPAMPVEITIVKPDGKTFQRQVLMSDENGALGIDIVLPHDALLGVYRVTAAMPQTRTVYGAAEFSAEEYMPARIKVDLRLKTEKIRPGAPVAIEVSGEHLFGGALAGNSARVEIDLVSRVFAPPGFEHHQFGNPLLSFERDAITLPDQSLDEQGVAIFAYTLPADIQPPSRLHLVASASVREAGGRAVSMTREWPADAYETYIGLKLVTSKPTDRTAEIGIVAVTPDGVPDTRAQTVTVRLSQLTWRYSRIFDSGRRYRYQSTRIPTPLNTMQVDLKNGRGTARLNLSGGSEYSVEAFGAGTNRPAITWYSYEDEHIEHDRENSERLTLNADRPDYAIGDTAIVTVRAPFPGRLVYALEQDRVISIHEMTLTHNSAELRIPIRAPYLPQVFVSALVLRPADRNTEGEVIRSMGIARLRIRDKSKVLHVMIETPDAVKPNQAFKAVVRVQTGAGCPAAGATVTLAAVDEGILALTGFPTPDPQAFLSADRRHAVETRDFYDDLFPEYAEQPAPGGDASRKRTMMRPNVRRVESVVLWRKIRLGPDGAAVLPMTVPQFNGRLRWMVVAATRAATGSAEATMHVREPLMVEPSLPRFAGFHDTFDIPISVYNRTGHAGLARISFDIEYGGRVMGDSSRLARIDDGAETTVWFSVRTGSWMGGMKAVIRAALGGESTRHMVQLPVRPVTQPVTRMDYRVIGPAGRAHFDMLKEFYPGTQKSRLMVTSNPVARLAGALHYVAHYPYGCVEQTSSATFPLLYLTDLAAVVDPEKFSPAKIHSYVQAGLFRVMSMQTPDGGLAYWPGGHENYPWGTCYGGHLLVEAARAGYTVYPESLELLKKYLRWLMRDSGDDNIRSYAAYVLALDGERVIPDIERFSRKSGLSSSAQFHLAAAYALNGDVSMARSLFGDRLPAGGVMRELDGTLNSDVRQDAVMLSALISSVPDHPLVPKLSDRLVSHLKENRWHNTQENGFALMALGKLAKRWKLTTDTPTARILVDGREVGRAGREPISTFPLENAGVVDIASITETEGRPFYALLMSSGVPLIPDNQDRTAGLTVRRKFMTTDGKTPADFRQGELYVAELTVSAVDRFPNVVMLDLLPAGFEIENPRLMTSAGTALDKLDEIESPFSPSFLEMRDDRLVLFGTVDEEDRVYRYLVRAVTAGEYSLPPVSAECMYDPGRFGQSGAGRVTIRRAR